MVNALPSDSVGLVAPTVYHFDEPLQLANGRVLDRYDLVVETYGQLNAQKSNAVLICHALSGHHHAAGKHSEDDKKEGWWDHYIGPGKPIDTNRFFVVSLNNLGGCHGSTGPQSIDPKTGDPWGANFPNLRVRDWVLSQYRRHASLALVAGISQPTASLRGHSLGDEAHGAKHRVQ
jgi:homoserine O-acetyltransferase/O-succinyltransferase